MRLAAGCELVDIAGRRLECRWAAPAVAGRPVLVFLHEGLGCAAIWRDFPDRVAAATGCGALVYSRAGYGGSDPLPGPRPLSYLRDEGLEVLPALLARFALSDAVLIGHSDGGSIAVIGAGSAAGPAVRGAVLLAPHVFNEAFCIAGIRAAAAAYQTTDLRDRLARLHDDRVDAVFAGWRDVWLHPDYQQWNIEEYLPRIAAPLLVIQGRDDQYGTAAQHQAIARQSGGPVETLVLDDCGHVPHREQPDGTLAAIRRFVVSLSPSAP